MIDGIGMPLGPLHGPSKPTPPVTPAPVPPADPAPSTSAPAPARPAGDQLQLRPTRLDGFELGPLPFAAADPERPPTPADWQGIALATRQAGFGGLLDRLTADAAARDPDRAADLPVLFDAPAGWKAPARQTLDVARRLNAQGWGESAAAVAALAGETAAPGDRAAHLAAAMLADRAGGRAEASHVLFRLAERAPTTADALAAGRRALAMGYPENARHAYWRAASLAPDAAGALAVAREATAAGLGFEAGEPAFQAWRERQDAAFRAMEGPTVTSPPAPASASASPYGPRALPRAAYISPYVAAVRKAGPGELGQVARAATLAGEGATAALAWRRLRETAL